MMNMDDTPAIEGTFTCADSPCSLVYTGSGDDVMVTVATGYTFSGRREGVTAVEAAADGRLPPLRCLVG